MVLMMLMLDDDDAPYFKVFEIVGLAIVSGSYGKFFTKETLTPAYHMHSQIDRQIERKDERTNERKKSKSSVDRTLTIAVFFLQQSLCLCCVCTA